jgi:putative flippase GtrA
VTGPKRLILAIYDDSRARYVAVGGTSAVVYYVVFAAGYWLVGRHVQYLILAFVTNLINCVLMYPLYRSVVFRSTAPWLRGFYRYYVICLWSFVFAVILLPPLIELLHIPVLVSILIVLVLQPIVNYQANKLWAFRHRAKPTTSVDSAASTPTGEELSTDHAPH